MYGPFVFYLCLFSDPDKLSDLFNLFCRIKHVVFVVRVGLWSINIGIHLYVPAKPHQTFTPFVAPSAIESFNKSTHLHTRIIFNLHIQKSLSCKRWKHHLQSSQAIVHCVRVLSQNDNRAVFRTQKIGICLLKKICFGDGHIGIRPGIDGVAAAFDSQKNLLPRSNRAALCFRPPVILQNFCQKRIRIIVNAVLAYHLYLCSKRELSSRILCVLRNRINRIGILRGSITVMQYLFRICRLFICRSRKDTRNHHSCRQKKADNFLCSFHKRPPYSMVSLPKSSYMILL